MNFTRKEPYEHSRSRSLVASPSKGERHKSLVDLGKLKRHTNMNVFKIQQVLDVNFNSVICSSINEEDNSVYDGRRLSTR